MLESVQTARIAEKAQALPRRRLVRRRLVSAAGVHVSETFSSPERGRAAQSLTEIRLVVVFSNVLRRRLVAAPLPLTEAPLRQPLRRYKAPVTNDLVLTGGLAIPEKREDFSTSKVAGKPFQQGKEVALARVRSVKHAIRSAGVLRITV